MMLLQYFAKKINRVDVMRFNLKLELENFNDRKITFNYQYPLAAAIYKIIQNADKEYAKYLHDIGYIHNQKTFKLFTFSDLRTPFDFQGDCLIMKTNSAELTICFHIPNAAENFIKGLFMNQHLVIADSTHKVSFIVNQVSAEKIPMLSGLKEIVLQPMSPVVVGRKNERGNYDYLSPNEEDYSAIVINNLVGKYAAASVTKVDDLNILREKIIIKPIFFTHAPRHRLLTIKAGTHDETKVRGYDKFRFNIKAPEIIIEMALNAGIGMHNAMGMGCVGLVNTEKC